MILIITALSLSGWLFLGAYRSWATDPRSVRWVMASGEVLVGEAHVRCHRDGVAVVQGSEAWWACEAIIGYLGDTRFSHGVVAWVDLEHARGILIPAQEQYSFDGHAALIPAAPPERAVLSVWRSRRDKDSYVVVAGVATPKGWVGSPRVIEHDRFGPIAARWRAGHFEVTFSPKTGSLRGVVVGLDGELSALPAATRAPAPDREPPAAELVCSDCRLSRIKPTAADVIDGELRIRPRWELRHPPEFYSTSGGERETGDNLELLPGGLQVVSGDQSAGILRGRKLVNRTHSYGFPWGGSRMIWFQRPDGGFRLFDDDGSYVTLDENMRRTDPLLPHEQLALPTQRLHSLSSREKFALFGWLLAALPVGIALLWKHGKLKRKKLAIALLAAYAFSLYVSIDLLRDHVRLMREQAAVIG